MNASLRSPRVSILRANLIPASKMARMRCTLDNNCLIAVANEESSSGAILELMRAHKEGRAEVAVLGISASERQPGGYYLQNIETFIEWLGSIGLGGLTIYKPTGIWGVTFWGWSDCPSEKAAALEQQIHDVMFPSNEFRWGDVAMAAGEPIDSSTGPAYRRWRNRRCDVQGMLAHILNDGDVFVSGDQHFLKNRAALIELGAKEVLSPGEAAKLYSGPTTTI